MLFLVLFDTPAGYALFQILDPDILNDDHELMSVSFHSVDEAKQVVHLIDFQNFSEINDAVSSTFDGNEGLIPEVIEKLLEKVDRTDGVTLLLSDQKLGLAIQRKFNIDFLCGTNVLELIRCIRSQLHGLIGLTSWFLEDDMRQLSIALAHNIGQRKIQDDPDTVDSMIKHAIRAYDHIEKSIQFYFRRLKSWYGDHFPELVFIVPDMSSYVKTMSLLWHRYNAEDTDLSSVLSPMLERAVKDAAASSTGSEINPPEFPLLNDLADQIVEMCDLKSELESYLETRMKALAPNVTAIAGSLITARLIAEAGSLLKLAKKPASTISLYGAAKALFTALKNGSNETPKHGFLFTSKLVQDAESSKTRGKVSRGLACKIVQAARIDSFAENKEENTDFANVAMTKLQARLERLNHEVEQRELKAKTKTPAAVVELIPVILNGTTTQANNTGTSKLRPSPTTGSITAKGFGLRRRRTGNGGIGKRQYEKIVRRGVKRSYSSSFPSTIFMGGSDDYWGEAPNKKIKFCEAMPL